MGGSPRPHAASPELVVEEAEMATERLPMRKIKEILRLKWLEGRRHRHIARALQVSVGKVSAVVRRAAAVGLEWERVAPLSEAELEAAIYGAVGRPLKTPLPDPAWMDLELKKPGVTVQLLHVEYRERYPAGYGYTQFCAHYRRWKTRQKLVMRQVHRAGEKLFTDFAGKKPHWIDPTTGEVREAELFVAALGASNLTYAEALESQQVPHWIAAHTRALEYCQGVPELVVPDQLRSAVTGPCRYEPVIQRTFEEWGRHYGTVILPARPAHPRDKAKVEAAVLVAERWILARLRHQRFFSLAELNARIAELREDLNGRTMRRYGKSRRALFDELERFHAPAASVPALHLRRVEQSEGQHRLPRRDRPLLLLGALPAGRAHASRRGSGRAPWSSSTRARAWPPMGARSAGGSTPPTPHICRARTASTSNGRHRG